MLPYKVDDEDEDDYVVEGRDPEGIQPPTCPYHTPCQYTQSHTLSMHTLSYQERQPRR